MAVRKILTIPNEILITKSQKVTRFDEEIKGVIQDLLDTVRVAKDPEAAGIAANQIGVTKRICVVRNFIDDPIHPNNLIVEDIVLVNPKIISYSKETDIDWDGCLSVPNVWGKVKRYKKIKVSALNENGEEIRLRAQGFFSRVIQHEMDHLDGVLFTEKIIGKTLTESELDKLMQSEKE